MLEEPRSCNACDGAVDVMIIQQHLADGRSVPMKIGACLRCGKWFNESGLQELPLRPTQPRPDRS